METPLIAEPEELRTLSIILRHPEYMAKAAARLTEEDFAVSFAREIWKAAYTVFQETGTVSMTTVFWETRKRNAASSMEALVECRDTFLSVNEFEPCIEVLKLAATRRRLYAAGEKIIEAAQDVNRDNAVGLEIAAQGFVWGAIQQVGKKDVTHLGEVGRLLAEEVKDAKNGKPVRRIGTGFPATLDRYLGGGLAPGDLIVLAGRTGTGKTALAENIALHVANLHGAVLYFSPEMNDKSLAQRAFQMLGPLRAEMLRLPTDSTIQCMDKTLATFEKWPFYIADQRSVSVPDVVAMSQAFQLEHPNLSLIVIDHFGELSIPTGKDKNLPRTLGEMASRLRQLAADLDVPLLLLHQLNRGVEGKRPCKADLRDSGRIEEIADVILLLYRKPDLPAGMERLAELIIDKNRRTGWEQTLIIEFLNEFVRYQEASVDLQNHYKRMILEKNV